MRFSIFTILRNSAGRVEITAQREWTSFGRTAIGCVVLASQFFGIVPVVSRLLPKERGPPSGGLQSGVRF